MKLDRDTILATALAMADDQGIDGLSMRKLAKAMGVGTMSLYTYVDNKDDVLMGITDKIVQQFELADGPWKPSIRDMALHANLLLVRHPWATSQMMAGPVGPARLAFYDRILGTFRKAGFDKAQARRGFLSIDAHILGFTQQEAAMPPVDQRPEAGRMFLQMLDKAKTPFVVEMVQSMVDGEDEAAYTTTFVYVLDLILDGLERELAGF